MADARQRTTFGTLFRFTIRSLGLTGLLAVVVGGALLATSEMPAIEWPADGRTADQLTAVATAGWNNLNAAVHGRFGDRATVASWVLGVGAVAVALWLVVELLGALTLVTGRRTAVGANGYLQIGLAVALVGLVNAWSFSHYRRFDCTRDHQFTLPADVRDEVEKVTTPTDIIVLLLHKTPGGLDKPDALDFAAERKVIEKVRDAVDQFRELGPQFRVSVLDVEEEGYGGKVQALTRDAPELKAAIDAAPENSILFRSGKAVQRIRFSDFYLLDKTASKGADGTMIANLELIPQGVGRLARRITDLDAKKPKVGLLAIHPVLSTQGTDWGAGGVRKALETNGFDVKDVMVKRWDAGPPAPASSTLEEHELDDLQGQYLALKEEVAEWEARAAAVAADVQKLKALELPVRVEIAGAVIRVETDDDRKALIARLNRAIDQAKDEGAARAKQLVEVGPKYFAAIKNDRAMEGRKVSDLKAKFAADIADCDALIVPRLTTYDVAKGGIIAPSYFPLGAEHADGIKTFLAAGKPVLFAFGPIEFGLPPRGDEADAPPDEVELLLARFGIEFGRPAVMTDAEGQTVGRQQRGRLGTADPLPPLTISQPAGKANPIAAAMLLSGRATGRPPELRASGPRVVYLNPNVAAALPYAGEVLATVKESWNEDRPLGRGRSRPKFEATPENDPKRNTRDEERRGPFPVGVAVEAPVPADWLAPVVLAPQAALAVGEAVAGPFAAGAALAVSPRAFVSEVPEKDRPPARTVRVVALGHGGLFTGKQLDPGPANLLLHSLNWQLRRDDALPRDRADAQEWRFPRAHLSERDATLWRWGTAAGLPILAGYFGLMMLMVRKVR